MKNHTMGRWIAVAATVMLTAGNFTGIAQAAGGTLPVAEIKKPEEPHMKKLLSLLLVERRRFKDAGCR